MRLYNQVMLLTLDYWTTELAVLSTTLCYCLIPVLIAVGQAPVALNSGCTLERLEEVLPGDPVFIVGQAGPGTGVCIKSYTGDSEKQPELRTNVCSLLLSPPFMALDRGASTVASSSRSSDSRP